MGESFYFRKALVFEGIESNVHRNEESHKHAESSIANRLYIFFWAGKKAPQLTTKRMHSFTCAHDIE